MPLYWHSHPFSPTSSCWPLLTYDLFTWKYLSIDKLHFLSSCCVSFRNDFALWIPTEVIYLSSLCLWNILCIVYGCFVSILLMRSTLESWFVCCLILHIKNAIDTMWNEVELQAFVRSSSWDERITQMDPFRLFVHLRRKSWRARNVTIQFDVLLWLFSFYLCVHVTVFVFRIVFSTWEFYIKSHNVVYVSRRMYLFSFLPVNF